MALKNSQSAPGNGTARAFTLKLTGAVELANDSVVSASFSFGYSVRQAMP